MAVFILLVVGGLNWLLHAFGFNVVDMIFGEGSLLAKIIYILVGLAAIVEVITHKGNCKVCNAGGGSSAAATGDMTHG